MSVDIACGKHPRYSGQQRPKTHCADCEIIHTIVWRIRNAKLLSSYRLRFFTKGRWR